MRPAKPVEVAPHPGRELGGGGAAAEVGRAQLAQRGHHRRLHRAGQLRATERQLQHHGHRQDRAHRVRGAVAGQVGRRAVDGLVERRSLAEGGRRQQADRADDHTHLVAQDVAEEVLGQDHVEAVGGLQQLEGGRIHVAVLQLDVRVFPGHLGHHPPPQP